MIVRKVKVLLSKGYGCQRLLTSSMFVGIECDNFQFNYVWVGAKHARVSGKGNLECQI